GERLLHLLERLIDRRHLLPPLRLRLRIVARGHLLQNRLGDRDRPPFLAHPPVVVDAQVARQAERPGRQRSLAAIPAQVLEQAEKNLLRQILRLRPRSGELERQVVQPFAIQLEDLVPGARLSRRSPAGEEEVRSRVGGEEGRHRGNLSLYSPRRDSAGKGSRGATFYSVAGLKSASPQVG